MTHSLPEIKPPSRKARLAAGGVFVLALLAATLVWNNTRNGNAFLTYSDSGIDGLTATLKTAQGTQSLIQTGGHFSLPENLQNTLAAPYRLSFAVPAKNGERQDFVLNVSQGGKQLTVSLDGFMPDDTVSLTLADNKAFKDVPMDWGGRNELVAAIDNTAAVKACIEINGAVPALLCHVIPQRGKA